MDSFPYSSLSHGYTRGWPRWRVIDSGEAAMQLGNGVLRTRDELGQSIYAIDLVLSAMTKADAVTIWTFIASNRAKIFLWTDTGRGPLSTADAQVWPCRFDPGSPPSIVPREDGRSYYDVRITLLPVLPTAPYSSSPSTSPSASASSSASA